MSSFVSANGPSTTVRLLPENRIRLPFELGWRPSPASMMPALTSSSLYLPMSLRSFSVGRAPASEFFVALTITMTLIVFSLVRARPHASLLKGDESARAGSTRAPAFFGFARRFHERSAFSVGCAGDERPWSGRPAGSTPLRTGIGVLDGRWVLTDCGAELAVSIAARVLRAEFEIKDAANRSVLMSPSTHVPRNDEVDDPAERHLRRDLLQGSRLRVRVRRSERFRKEDPGGQYDGGNASGQKAIGWVRRRAKGRSTRGRTRRHGELLLRRR